MSLHLISPLNLLPYPLLYDKARPYAHAEIEWPGQCQGVRICQVCLTQEPSALYWNPVGEVSVTAQFRLGGHRDAKADGIKVMV